jgi:succinate dehydrogenase/fumarate reductase flavoprotein subunit
VSSGSWAGQGAAAFATTRAVAGRLIAAGTAGLRPHGQVALDHRAVVAEVQRQVLPYDVNYLRHGDRLRSALDSLDHAWAAAREGLGGTGEDVFRAREAAAMLAHGRWMFHAALARTESRGMHKRRDRPGLDPAQQHRLLTGGLDGLWTRPERGTLGRAA